MCRSRRYVRPSASQGSKSPSALASPPSALSSVLDSSSSMRTPTISLSQRSGGRNDREEMVRLEAVPAGRDVNHSPKYRCIVPRSSATPSLPKMSPTTRNAKTSAVRGRKSRTKAERRSLELSQRYTARFFRRCALFSSSPPSFVAPSSPGMETSFGSQHLTKREKAIGSSAEAPDAAAAIIAPGGRSASRLPRPATASWVSSQDWASAAHGLSSLPPPPPSPSFSSFTPSEVMLELVSNLWRTP
mmetsp:Transcript_58373/g.173941  ORF Transcript_58373/g.173941 Transcript_58373/m.173941 type:complete len:245 (+) Transcript_58373:1833-2567(+)